MANEALNFQAIYREYQPKIQRYLAGMLGESEAEELAQEVLVKIDKALPDFRGEAGLSTWIYRIATNAALDRLRSAAYKQRVREASGDEAGGDAAADTLDRNVWTGEQRPDSDQALIRKEMNSCIREYVDQLPEDYRTVLLLSEAEGFKNREIAEILEVSLDTVKIRLHRARAKLKESLQSHCNFHLDERSELACERKECDPS